MEDCIGSNIYVRPEMKRDGLGAQNSSGGKKNEFEWDI